MKLLQINSSLLGENSVSIELGNVLAQKLGGEVQVVDTNKLPAIDTAWLAASRTPAENRSEDQQELVNLSDGLIESVEAADALIIGLPVYNFGVPVGLKNWIDTMARAGTTFRYTESGSEGLLTSKPVYVVYSAGGVARGSDFDHASGQLVQALNFFGLTDITFITADSMVMDPVGSKERALKDIDAVVSSLA